MKLDFSNINLCFLILFIFRPGYLLTAPRPLGLISFSPLPFHALYNLIPITRPLCDPLKFFQAKCLAQKWFLCPRKNIFHRIADKLIQLRTRSIIMTNACLSALAICLCCFIACLSLHSHRVLCNLVLSLHLNGFLSLHLNGWCDVETFKRLLWTTCQSIVSSPLCWLCLKSTTWLKISHLNP